MRPIKFRAWDKDGGKFLEGDFSLGIISGKVRGIYGEVFSGIEITQFTGLLDKNGKEIYEGDILTIGLKTDEGNVWLKREAVIIWNECGFHLDYTQSRLKSDKGVGICDVNPHTREFEVIGNIYENPELLK